MRRMIDFVCAGDSLVGTLDEAAGTTGLLIVSGGNEIRSGAYAGQAAMAQLFAERGYPVFRYDRRGIGDSEGINTGFDSSAADIAAATAAFRKAAPHVSRLVGFGNCDAATALAMFHADLVINALALANPWVIETMTSDDAPAQPSATAIRARYLARLRNPRSLLDLLTGKIDLKKLAGGLAKAAQAEAPSGLAQHIAAALSANSKPVRILIADRDTTALAFLGAWKSEYFAAARNSGYVRLDCCQTASHSFADATAKQWLYERIEQMLAERD